MQRAVPLCALQPLRFIHGSAVFTSSVFAMQATHLRLPGSKGSAPTGELQPLPHLTLQWWACFMNPGLPMQDAHHSEEPQATRRQGLCHPARLWL